VGAEVGKYANGAPDKDDKGNHVRVKSESSSQGVNIQGDGDLSINAAGKLSMEGTKTDMGGSSQIDAAGGITQQAAAKDKKSSKGIGGQAPKTEKKAEPEESPQQEETPEPKATGAKMSAELAAKLKAAAEDLKKSQAEIGKLR
jgi:hypothetical protein